MENTPETPKLPQSDNFNSFNFSQLGSPLGSQLGSPYNLNPFDTGSPKQPATNKPPESCFIAPITIQISLVEKDAPVNFVRLKSRLSDIFQNHDYYKQFNINTITTVGFHDNRTVNLVSLAFPVPFKTHAHKDIFLTKFIDLLTNILYTNQVKYIIDFGSNKEFTTPSIESTTTIKRR